VSETKVVDGLRYSPSHEWIRVEADLVTVGITDHAQAELTDIVFVDLPVAGKAVVQGASVMVLESVKTVADIFAPANGTVVEGNAELKNHPELVNQDPYGAGWLVRLRITGPLDAGLLDAAGYRALVASGA
jgi:glycine cleavage system H protein